jgi:hypothetical protein
LQPIGSFGVTCNQRLLAGPLAAHPGRMHLSFGRLMIGPNVSVLIECKPDEPKHNQDGSGHHHPMGVFPIEQQVEHFGHCPSLDIFSF